MTSTRRWFRLSFLVIFLISTTLISIPAQDTEAFTSQVIQQGSTGDDVIELQARLQYIGFYKGQIDGVFGWQTYWALRNFQKDFGLKVDGLAGLKTRQKLVDATKYDEQWVRKQIHNNRDFTYYGGTPKKKQTEHSPGYWQSRDGGGKGQANQQNQQNQQNAQQQNQQNQQNRQGQQGGQNDDRRIREAENVPDGYSQNDIQLMANAVHGEARGEPYVGQVAIAGVIVNRVESGKFPDTVSGVIFEPGAFTAVSDGQIWLTPDKRSKKAVLDALNGWDPSGNALYYFNPVTATSDWIWSRPQIKKIGKHIFAK